ncbi:conserved oligomeric Golgi complex subunit 8-like [Pollicipes pollicipes]|uniref:conserved oligomeric Golgi complex subunit 8-like n=1 Tax=Pollicipes pollicipes TaxID=41117 RepID=UPI00188580F4|nr:conserved oligomeric Golgi complex subunit 8-like [Pollicipes pollicipes]XP_037091970.1 conserved oligomeric Golgi complex subunit 8-like [Pollicipes pollicipes]XP_037091971.1 conserved oligomeric Golgi complex subunit 8-like [Pollicipes pollicipes]
MMNESNRELLNRLFPGQEKDLENDVDVNNYLAQISTFGVEKLRTEGVRIQEEMAHTLQQTQDLAFQNYKTFVETAECSSAVLREFTSVEERLDRLLAELPEFAGRCAEFGRRGAEIQARRRLNSTTLTKHTELLEVLELPQLMDTGVRNGYYDQAMELVTHVRSLEKKHGHIRLVEGIVADVQLAYRSMLTQLVSQLRTNIQLPQCLKVIGHLRRMEVFTEFELRLKFLQARNAWLDEQLSNISRDDPYHHISKTIEVSRVSLFDIVTQYRAVFSDESALLQAGADEAAPAIFYEWINLKVDQFVRTLRQDLARGVGSRLDSLLSQTMYFGLSLARVGADLRPLAAPLFQQAALAQFQRTLDAATARFRQYMDAFTCMKARVTASPAALEPPSAAQDPLQPPASLLDYLPLAHYCNGALAAFNELRLCPALGLVHEVAALLRDSLAAVVGRVVDLYHTDSQGLTEAERRNYSRFCRCLARDLVPYLSRCLAAVFPADQLAPALGLSAAALTKRGIGSLDVPVLVGPLQEFLSEPAEVPATAASAAAPTVPAPAVPAPADAGAAASSAALESAADPAEAAHTAGPSAQSPPGGHEQAAGVGAAGHGSGAEVTPPADGAAEGEAAARPADGGVLPAASGAPEEAPEVTPLTSEPSEPAGEAAPEGNHAPSAAEVDPVGPADLHTDASLLREALDDDDPGLVMTAPQRPPQL